MSIYNMARNAEKQKKRGEHTDVQTIRRVIQTFSPYKFQLLLVLIAIISISLLDLLNPLMIRLIFDDAIKYNNIGHLLVFVFIMFTTPILTGTIGVGQTYLSNVAGQRVMRDFRKKLYSHLQRMSLNFFTSVRVGEIQSRLSNDVSSAQNVITDTATRVVANISIAVSTIIAMLYISPLLTLISLCLLPLFLWITYKVGNVNRRTQKATQQSLASLTALMQETLSISGVLLIKNFGRQQFAQKQFDEENETLTRMGIRQQMIGRWFLMLVTVILATTPAIIYLIAGWQIIHSPDSITLGGIVAFTTLQTRLLPPLGQLLNIQIQVQGALALFDRIFEYLDLPVDIQDAPHALYLSPEEVRGEVAFKDVSFSYPAASSSRDPKQLGQKQKLTPEDQASNSGGTLKSVSFTIKPGQLAALVGPSGAGKTTITYLISRLYDVDSGSVSIDGHNVKDLALASLSDLVGTVTQETYLFHGSVKDNLRFVRPDATEEELIAAAKAASVHDRIMELSDGYETIVGERGYRLSGGEKQRIAIARVLLKNPRILILDEATSALDTHSERFIQSALEPLMKNRTSIAIAHRLSTILSADIILVVDCGQIVERGTHQELLAKGGLYAELYAKQFFPDLKEEMLESTVEADSK